MYTSPLTAFSGWDSSASALSASSTMLSAYSRSRAPSSVSATRFAPRSNSCLPKPFSKSANWRDKVGCVTCSALAAFEMVPS